MKTRKIFILLFILSALAVNGQVRQPHSLYFMQTIPQVSQMNPAMQPRANSYVALPVNINFDVSLDLALKDIFQGKEQYMPFEKQFDYKKFYKSIGKNATMINSEIDLDIIGFGFRAGNNYFRFGVSEHFTLSFALPSDFFKIPEKGFPEGERFDFSPLRVKSMAYMQITVGYSYTFNEKLTIGLNVKPILGQAAILSDLEKFEMRTGIEAWKVDARGKINVSGPFVKDEENDNIFAFKANENLYDDEDNLNTQYILDNYLLGFSNPGLALDFGATYQLNERLTLSAAINNLGLITWRKDDDLHGRKFNSSFAFEGLEFNTAEDEFDIDINKIIDEIFKFEDEELDDNEKNFTTSLTPNIYLGGQYSLTEALSVGLMSRTAFWNRAVRQSFNLSLYWQPYSFVGFNVGTTYQVKGNAYLGTGLMFLLGPLQFYFLADYIPISYTTITTVSKNENGVKEKSTLGEGFLPNYFDAYPIPPRQKSFTYRLGLNLIFGKHGYVDKPMLDKGKSSWN